MAHRITFTVGTVMLLTAAVIPRALGQDGQRSSIYSNLGDTYGKQRSASNSSVSESGRTSTQSGYTQRGFVGPSTEWTKVQRALLNSGQPLARAILANPEKYLVVFWRGCKGTPSRNGGAATCEARPNYQQLLSKARNLAGEPLTLVVVSEDGTVPSGFDLRAQGANYMKIESDPNAPILLDWVGFNGATKKFSDTDDSYISRPFRQIENPKNTLLRGLVKNQEAGERSRGIAASAEADGYVQNYGWSRNQNSINLGPSPANVPDASDGMNGKTGKTMTSDSAEGYI